MNTNPHNAMSSDSGRDCGEATLRLIAGLPAPAGLEERVHRALRAAPRESQGAGRVLAWPARFRAKAVLESNWMRATAAAAIVFVVVEMCIRDSSLSLRKLGLLSRRWLWMAARGRMERAESVSYTHLWECACFRSWVSVLRDPPPTPAVSYTHLDVYKRQSQCMWETT